MNINVYVTYDIYLYNEEGSAFREIHPYNLKTQIKLIPSQERKLIKTLK